MAAAVWKSIFSSPQAISSLPFAEAVNFSREILNSKLIELIVFIQQKAKQMFLK